MDHIEEELQRLDNLRVMGMISEQEYQDRRNRLLGVPVTIWGMDESSFLLLMHLSQLTGFLLPLLMWLLNRENPLVNKHGENIANFMISMYIYMMIAGFLCFFIIGLFILPVLLVLHLVFIIRIALDANNNIYTDYPLCIKIFPAK